MELEFPDTYSIQLTHVNGSIGNLMIDLVSREAVRKLEILNENLYMSWSGTGEYIHEHGYGDFINEYAYVKEIEAFLEVMKGSNAAYDFEKDREILALIDEIEK